MLTFNKETMVNQLTKIDLAEFQDKVLKKQHQQSSRLNSMRTTSWNQVGRNFREYKFIGSRKNLGEFEQDKGRDHPIAAIACNISMT